MSAPVYLDNNATTPIDPTVREIIKNSLELHWANPSSDSESGQAAKRAVILSRTRLGKSIGASKQDSLYFTSGGTESNNWAILSSVQLFQQQNPGILPKVVTSNVEHDAVIKPLLRLKEEGQIELAVVPVETAGPHRGAVLPAAVLRHVEGPRNDHVCLVTVMAANNETGIVQPVAEIGARLSAVRGRRDYPLFHVDAAQVVGKMEVDVSEWRADLVTVVGHKFYGPRIGALFVRQGAPLRPLLLGGGQERGMRPGTENVPMIEGLASAAVLAADKKHHKELEYNRGALLRKLKAKLGDKVTDNFADVAESGRLCNTLSASFRGVRASDLHKRLKQHVSCSVSAACHSSSHAPFSPVVVASGVSQEAAVATLRFSVGRGVLLRQLDKAADKIAEAYNWLIEQDIN